MGVWLLEFLYFEKKDTMDGIGGRKCEKKGDTGIQISPTYKSAWVKDWEGRLAWCRGGLIRDSGIRVHVKMGDGWSMSEDVSFWTKIMGLRQIEKHNQI